MEMYGLLASGGIDLPIIKQISWLLGQVMNAIYNVMSAIGINNYRCMYHHIHGYCVHALDAPYDQAAEVY